MHQRVTVEIAPAALAPGAAVARVAVVRALPGLGDFLCAVPALRALRAAWPAARISLIGLPVARTFVARFPHYVDELLEFPGWPGMPERPVAERRLAAFLARARRLPFDLALQCHGSGRASAAFTQALGARRTAGFVPPEVAPPDPATFLPYREDESEVRRLLRLVAHLGVPARDERLEFPVTVDDVRALTRLVELPPRRYVCVHPGSALADRRWPTARFARAADALARRGLAVVLTGGERERPLTAAVAAAMTAPALDLAGRTSLGTLAALLARARLLLSNDTGVSHLAAAVGVPSVVVFVRTDPARWAPLDRRRHRAVGGVPAAAARVLDVPVEPVVAEAEALLAEAG